MAVLKDSYDVQSLMKEGTFAEIYLINDISDRNTKKVLKTVPFEKGGKHNTLEKAYKAEVRVYQKIANSENSRFFATFYDSFSMEGSGMIVLELLGKSVFEIRHQNTNKAFCSQNVRKIGYCVFKGLKYLHENGFLHLNLQEHHVLFTHPLVPEVPVKITDFGCSVKIFTRSGSRKEAKSRVNFTKCAYASLAQNQGLPPKPKDDYESLFFFLMSMMGKFNMFGTAEQIIQHKNELYFAPAKYLCQNKFLLSVWQSIGSQNRDGDLDLIPIHNSLYGGGIADFQAQIAHVNTGRLFVVD